MVNSVVVGGGAIVVGYCVLDSSKVVVFLSVVVVHSVAVAITTANRNPCGQIL